VEDAEEVRRRRAGSDDLRTDEPLPVVLGVAARTVGIVEHAHPDVAEGLLRAGRVVRAL
jgi:hypothetical protein